VDLVVQRLHDVRIERQGGSHEGIMMPPHDRVKRRSILAGGRL
jgi:hypothetical protein